MAITWRVGDRVRPKNGSRERTFVVQKVVVIKPHGMFRRSGSHQYTIRDLKTGQLQRVKPESLVRA